MVFQRLRLGLALLLVAAFGGAVFTAPAVAAEPTVQAASQLKILQFNMAGKAKNDGDLAVVSKIMEVITREQPDIVSLNEVCEGQYVSLRQRLDSAGYGMQGHFNRTRELACPSNGHTRAGLAILARAGVSAKTDYWFDGDDKISQSWWPTLGDSYSYGVTCLTAQFQTAVRACSAHLNPNDVKADKQVAELARVFGPAAESMPFVLAGDLNIVPRHGNLNSMARLYAQPAGDTGDFWEADMLEGCPGCAPDRRGEPTFHGGTDKIDYIFAGRNHFSGTVSATVEDAGQCDDHACSDHKMVWGTVDLVNEPLRVFQFNICGAKDDSLSGCVSKGDIDRGVVPHIVSSALDFKPDVITLNEVCRAQFAAISRKLQEAGYSMSGDFASAKANEDACKDHGVPDGKDFGNALLSRAPLAAVERMPLDNPDGSETRQLLCADTVLRSRTVKACVTHLSHIAGKQERQIEQIAQKLNPLVDAGQPVLLGGDLNVNPPTTSELNLLYSHHGGTGKFREADETDREYFDDCGQERSCRSGENTHPANPWFLRKKKKLDYVFADQVNFVGMDADATGTQWSDHVPLRAWVTLKDGVTDPPPGPFPPPPAGRNLPPIVSAGPDVSGDEGAGLTLRGSASDPEGNLSVSWAFEPGEGVDAGATCAFGDAHDPSTTIRCTDDGIFYATLTATDGVNEPVSDTARVRLVNVPPRPTVTGPDPWSVYRAGTPVSLTSTFVDPGTNDTHTCAIAWDDGTSDTFAASGGRCDRSHTFPQAGMFTIKLTVTDDDGGAGTADVMVVVYDPDGGFVTSGAHLDSPAGALTADPEVTGKAHAQFNPAYRKQDEGPVPGRGKVSFRLQGSGLDFDATRLEWLVVTPDRKVAIKGADGTHGFVLYGYDAQPDRLRMVIWPLSDGPIPGGTPTYDNRRTAGFDVDVAEPQEISGGNIKVH